MKKQRLLSARNIAYLSVLLALVVIMQTVGGSIKIGGVLELSFVLVPIVLGAILLGPWAGAFLGFIFGLITLIYGITGATWLTSVLFLDHPVLTALTCLVKGVAAGLIPGLCYRAISKKSSLGGAVVASALAPICNTAIFILGALLMSGTLSANAGVLGVEGQSAIYIIFIVLVGFNFLIEFALNIILSPIVHRVVSVTERAVGKKKGGKS